MPASLPPNYFGTSLRTALDLPILERRALKDELAELGREWRAAEEIAAIADELLLPGWRERRRALLLQEARIQGAMAFPIRWALADARGGVEAGATAQRASMRGPE